MNPYRSPIDDTNNVPERAGDRNRRRLATAYALPVCVAFAVAIYFAPFYLRIVPGDPSGIAFGFALVLSGFILFIAWIAAICMLVCGIRNLWRHDVNGLHQIVASILAAIAYLMFFLGLSHGYLLTAMSKPAASRRATARATACTYRSCDDFREQETGAAPTR